MIPWCLAEQGRWLPELQRIVRTISDDFGRNLRRLNCAGEVRSSHGACHHSCSDAVQVTSTNEAAEQ